MTTVEMLNDREYDKLMAADDGRLLVTSVLVSLLLDLWLDFDDFCKQPHARSQIRQAKMQWCDASRLQCLASRQIFTALVLVLVLDFGALALALVLKVDVLALDSVLEINVLVLVLSRDRDQDTNLQGKVPAFGAVVQACLACSEFTT